MKTYILQEKVPSRSDFKWTFSRNCEGTEQLQISMLSDTGADDSFFPVVTFDKIRYNCRIIQNERKTGLERILLLWNIHFMSLAGCS